MSALKYRLNEPFLKGKEKEYVLDVIDSGWLSVKGKHVKIFEKKFADFVGVKHAMAVQSGTAALHTALLALGVGPGDKVVIPNFTCGACATSVMQCGARPVIIDVENESFGIDIERLKECIVKEKPKAVMLVHIYGFPARDTEAIRDLCKAEKIFFIEDCSEALGAEYKGKKIGSFGDVATFSVRSEKMIGVGEGGIILTDDEALLDRAFYWAARACPYRDGSYPYWYQYCYTGMGMNYLMPHLLGAIGRAQIENFDEILARKRKIGTAYQKALKDFPGIQVQKVIDGSDPAYWLNIALFKDRSVDEIRRIGDALIKDGVEIRPGFWPLGSQDYFREFAFGTQQVGDSIFEKGIVLPSSVFLADNNCESIGKIIELLVKAMKAS